MSKAILNAKIKSAFGNFCSLSQKRVSHKTHNKMEIFPNKKQQMNIGVKINNYNNKKYLHPINKPNFNSTSSNSNEHKNNSNLCSNSSNYNDDNNKIVESNEYKKSENIIALDSDNDIYEDEEFFNFMRFDLKRKIKRKDIEWESKYYSIWDPDFSDDDINNIQTSQHK